MSLLCDQHCCSWCTRDQGSSVEDAGIAVVVEVESVMEVEVVGSDQCSHCVASAEGAVDHHPTGG